MALNERGSQSLPIEPGISIPFRWPLAIGLGAAIVALSARLAVPLPFTPVPLSLEDLAVLLVGGFLGATAGSGAMILYLSLGALGAPVFALGTGGITRLLGPSGGYLLAFPVAATAVARIAVRGNLARCLAAALVGTMLIHAGGLAQLMVLGQSLKHALALGTLPFLLQDLLKTVIAALILTAGAATLRPRA
ncbi:MAG: biotin transporter BioY [Gemmatimonadota bacterium]